MRPALLLTAALLALAAPVQAQETALQPRFGGGGETSLFLGNPSLLQNGIGIGVRGRVSFPLNADFSVAADAGLLGFLLGGRDNATYVFSPQVSGIVTFPSAGQARYVVGGLGWYAPLGSARASGGPALHGGMGWVTPLQETALFFELNPALVIGDAGVSFVIPARVGVIF
jgi:hypothetical protein